MLTYFDSNIIMLAAALQIGADEFVTAESPRKSRLARTTRLPVRLN